MNSFKLVLLFLTLSMNSFGRDLVLRVNGVVVNHDVRISLDDEIQFEVTDLEKSYYYLDSSTQRRLAKESEYPIKIPREGRNLSLGQKVAFSHVVDSEDLKTGYLEIGLYSGDNPSGNDFDNEGDLILMVVPD